MCKIKLLKEANKIREKLKPYGQDLGCADEHINFISNFSWGLGRFRTFHSQIRFIAAMEADVILKPCCLFSSLWNSLVATFSNANPGFVPETESIELCDLYDAKFDVQDSDTIQVRAAKIFDKRVTEPLSKMGLDARAAHAFVRSELFYAGIAAIAYNEESFAALRGDEWFNIERAPQPDVLIKGCLASTALTTFQHKYTELLESTDKTLKALSVTAPVNLN